MLRALTTYLEASGWTINSSESAGEEASGS
jgi:hypothetical protein